MKSIVLLMLLLISPILLLYCDGPFPSSVYFTETRFERETEGSLLDEILIACC